MSMSSGSRCAPSFVPKRQKAPVTPVVAHTPEQRADTFLACGLLLDYPQENWDAVVLAARELAARLPAQVAEQLDSFCGWAVFSGRTHVQEAYVETFDRKRRCALELTYYATGDTRQRGIALTIFQDLYAAVGFEPPRGEALPDYLPRVLELAARCEGEDLQLVEGAIAANREGVEILHAALASFDSPWAKVVAALRMALPQVDEATEQRIFQLIRQGPPTELVGLDQPQDLPWPTDMMHAPDGSKVTGRDSAGRSASGRGAKGSAAAAQDAGDDGATATQTAGAEQNVAGREAGKGTVR